MAELLIRVADKINEDDPKLDAQCLKRGDVVVICEDGWEWGSGELSNPDWRILAVPGISADKLTALITPEPKAAPELGGPDGDEFLQQARAFSLDLDDPRLRQIMRRGARGKGRDELTITLSAFLALVKPKAKRVNPRVLGRV